MTIGIVALKRGMTRVFMEDGISLPVTVVEVVPNHVVDLIKPEDRGYSAVQVAWGNKKQNSLNKPEAGVYAKAGVGGSQGLLEYRVSEEEVSKYSVGSELKVDMFKLGQKVDVTGTSKGKGYAGVIKRYNFSGQRNTHGNSLSHRAPGSIGQNQSPGRVFKGKKMAGHLGNVKRTVQNLDLVRIDSDRNLLLIKGSIPAAIGSKVIVKSAIKKNI